MLESVDPTSVENWKKSFPPVNIYSQRDSLKTGSTSFLRLKHQPFRSDILTYVVSVPYNVFSVAFTPSALLVYIHQQAPQAPQFVSV